MNKDNCYAKKLPAHQDFKDSQPVHEKGCSEGNTKGVVDQPSDKEVSLGMNHELNHLSRNTVGLK